MDAQRRNQYLEAIGIDTWVLRRGAAVQGEPDRGCRAGAGRGTGARCRVEGRCRQRIAGIAGIADVARGRQRRPYRSDGVHDF
jgi:hypothetical protein